MMNSPIQKGLASSSYLHPLKIEKLDQKDLNSL